MPLTIKPVNFVSALHAVEYPEIREYGNIHIWIGSVSYPEGTDSLPVSFTTKGFIRTTPSLVKGAHNCDNLQLFGDLIDFRYLQGCMTRPYKAPGLKSYDVLHFLDANSKNYVPAHQLVRWGDDFLLTCTDWWSNNPKLIAVLTTEHCCYTSIALVADGVLDPGTAYVDTTLVCYYEGIHVGVVKSRSKTVRISLSGITRTIENLRNVIIPKLKILLNDGWEKQPCVESSNTGSYFTGTSSLQGGSNLSDCYKSDEYSWLSALEEYTFKRVDFGELHYRTLSKIDTFGSNGIAYIKDLKNIIKDLKSLYQTLHGNVNPKGIADLFLSFKYGFPQTFEDTRDVVAAIKATPKTSSSVTEVESIAGITTERTCTIRYNPLDGAVEDVYNFLRQLDLLVNAQNVWELIPFSFVFDWFIDVDAKLERLDQLDHLSHINVNAVYDSQILTTSCASSRFIGGVVGTIGIRRYTRNCHLDASFPLIVSKEPSPVSHWLEGTALIVQRLFK